jgi:CO/xanthine dehydrogenase FAD-binding subunit
VTRARRAEEILEEGGPDAIAKASEAAATEVETVSDVDGSDAYKRHLVEVLLHRSLTSVYERNS